MVSHEKGPSEVVVGGYNFQSDPSRSVPENERSPAPYERERVARISLANVRWNCICLVLLHGRHVS